MAAPDNLKPLTPAQWNETLGVSCGRQIDDELGRYNRRSLSLKPFNPEMVEAADLLASKLYYWGVPVRETVPVSLSGVADAVNDLADTLPDQIEGGLANRVSDEVDSQLYSLLFAEGAPVKSRRVRSPNLETALFGGRGTFSSIPRDVESEADNVEDDRRQAVLREALMRYYTRWTRDLTVVYGQTVFGDKIIRGSVGGRIRSTLFSGIYHQIALMIRGDEELAEEVALLPRSFTEGFHTAGTLFVKGRKTRDLLVFVD